MRSRDPEFERKDRPAPVEDRDTICTTWLRSEGLAMTDDTCLCTGLRQAAHAMTEIYDEALAPSGLKITMFRVIRRLSEASEPTISELAKIVGLDRSSLGRNLKVLERDKLVTFAGGADERSKVVQLTSKGQKALETALPLWRDVQKRIKSTLGAEKDAVFRVLMIMEAEMRPGQNASLPMSPRGPSVSRPQLAARRTAPGAPPTRGNARRR